MYFVALGCVSCQKHLHYFLRTSLGPMAAVVIVEGGDVYGSTFNLLSTVRMVTILLKRPRSDTCFSYECEHSRLLQMKFTASDILRVRRGGRRATTQRWQENCRWGIICDRVQALRWCVASISTLRNLKLYNFSSNASSISA